MGTDDFSFPKIIDPVPTYTKSTSLWRVPSAVFIEPCNGNDTGGGGEDLCAFNKEENSQSNSKGREDFSTIKTKENSQSNKKGREDSSTITTEENSQGDNSGGGEDSSTIKKEENSQENNSRGGVDSSIIKKEENSRGREDSSTIKTDENFQENSSSLTVNDSKRWTSNEDEVMDMLWENFNDVELRRISSMNKKKQIGKLLGKELDSDNSEDKVDISCMGGGNIFSPRKPSLVVVLKVLKKLFLLQNAHCPKRNTPIGLY